MSIEFKGRENYSLPIAMQALYSDNTPLIKFEGYDTLLDRADTIVVKQSSLMEFVNAMFLVDSVRESGGRISRLVLPFLPGARQDRVNPTGDVLFTAKSVAEMINAHGFDEVISVDPHSPTMPGLINHFVEYPLAKVYEKLPNGYDGVIAPDKGAKGRAETAARVLNKPITYGSKVRDEATGRLSGFDIDVEYGKHYIVVDDICDGGGTFVGLGEKIVEQGATADLFVTHAIFSKGTDDLKKIYKNIYTTNTINNGPLYLDLYRFDVVTEMENY